MGADPREVVIPPHGLRGALAAPGPGHGVLVFAHGSGSSRLSPRNTFVATALRQRGLGTLLFDLMLPEEASDRGKVFDIGLLAGRLVQATDWLISPEGVDAAMPVGYFGASTGAGAALVAAAARPNTVHAVVSRGGRPDLAGPEALAHVRAPTLLIVGSLDAEVLALNRAAAAQMPGEVEIQVVHGASHLFEEPGTLEAVVALAGDWFTAHIGQERSRP